MDSKNLKSLLSKYTEEDVERYVSYIQKLSADEKTDFVQRLSDHKLADLFKRVANEWLKFDWIHVILLSTWVFYDYVALKNKMLLVYPETTFDVGMVYEWDSFSFSKESWKVKYSHKIANPFWNTEAKIMWAYAIIKNKRGEYITLLSKADLEKHRKTAKWDFIWQKWYTEMCMKTVIKKACKTHYGDIFTEIEEMDNENYDPNLESHPLNGGEWYIDTRTNDKWLSFDDYKSSIEMENDVEHIKILLKECLETLGLSEWQKELINSTAEKSIKRIINPTNRLPFPVA